MTNSHINKIRNRIRALRSTLRTTIGRPLLVPRSNDEEAYAIGHVLEGGCYQGITGGVEVGTNGDGLLGDSQKKITL